jgi:hypothetical protein
LLKKKIRKKKKILWRSAGKRDDKVSKGISPERTGTAGVL